MTRVIRKALAKSDLFWHFYLPFANLSQLGKRHGTDKGDIDHTFKGLSYLDVAAKYFRPFKKRPINLLEIGVKDGASLRMWKDYFPKANIYGLDIDPACKQHEEARISVEVGSQTDERVLEKLSGKAGSFDIVIDDGSHVNKHILKTFDYLFPKLNRGGIYLIEDLGCSYMRLEEEGGRKWPGMKYNDPAENLNNDREDMNKFFEKIISDLDHRRGEILSIQFWAYLCYIVKA